MAREAKFNFIPAHQVKNLFADDRELFVTVMTRPSKVISFPSNHPETKALIGKFVELFVDTEKNVIGWKVFKEGDVTDLKNAVQVKAYKTTGESSIVRLGITLPLRSLKYVDGTSYKKLQVKKYQQQGYLNDGKEIYYIEIPKTVKKED